MAYLGHLDGAERTARSVVTRHTVAVRRGHRQGPSSSPTSPLRGRAADRQPRSHVTNETP